ncbi:MAG: type II secretion system F family protein [Candidatus Zixiibacteriota bacterium]
MPTRYKYRALTSDGTAKDGFILAENTDQVVDYLTEQHLLPVSVRKAGQRRAFSLNVFKKTDYEGLILFTNNLLTMYRAGIPLLRALSIIRIGPEGSRFNTAIDQVRVDVQSGKPLSQALEREGQLFPKVYTSCIAAGEESGKLDDILEELAVVLEQEMELIRQIKSGVRYPLLVIGAITAAAFVLMTFVVPKFVAFYGSFGASLPLPTRILIEVSTFFTQYWAVLLAAVIAVILSFRKLTSTEKGKFWFDRQLLRLPVLGHLIIKGNVARFMMMFRILFKSGLPIIKSLDILQDSIKNSVIGQETRQLADLFREGKDTMLLSETFQFFPELALQMMTIGMESGSLERMLTQVGQYYRKEVQYVSRHLTAILEPMLTLFLGVFVLTLALAIFLPMWNLIRVFRGG